MFEKSKLELEYLEKKLAIENRYNGLISYFAWDCHNMHNRPTAKMLDELDKLDKIYLPLLEEEKNDLFE